MIRPRRFTQELSECRDIALVGGKATNLGRLLRAGFPVPDGFVVTTLAQKVRDEPGGHDRRGGHRGQRAGGTVCTLSEESTVSTHTDGIAPAVAEEIRAAYRRLGSPAVAVRSSATAEDQALVSMAGQYETFLNIEGEQALLEAIERCWASVDTPRVQTYLREHAIDSSRVGMAVVVQPLIPAEVAGVLFTANPQNGRSREMLLEASWGLGEMVVSGRVQPDVLRLERDTGRVLEAVIADKQVSLAARAHMPGQVDMSRRRKPCLHGRDVYRLWQLGRRAAEHFGCPQDIEWAVCGDQLYLLQSRPITTLGDIEVHEVLLSATQGHLRQEAAAGRGPWVLHNLAETLPHPTPLTWSIMKQFMSGTGGFGAMYRQAGFEPAPAVEQDGFLECIAGRVYMDVARAPEMLFAGFPFTYDLDELKRSPEASQSPPTLARGSLLSRCRAQRKLKAVQARLQALSANLEQESRGTLFEDIAIFVAGAKRLDLSSFSVPQLLELWEGQQREILDVFAPRLLLPGLIATWALGELRAFLHETLWDEDAEALAQLVSSGGEPDRTVLANAELYEVAQAVGANNDSPLLEMWLSRHGHRAAGEFELAQPRWREQPASVREMADRLAKGEGPLQRQCRHAEAVDKRLAWLRSLLRAGQRRELDRLVGLARRYLTLREDSKDFLMFGYDLLRDLALEAGRRLDIGGDVFYLTRDELFEALRVGFAPYHVIEQRKIAYRAESRLVLPRVIDAKAIVSLGDLPDVGANDHSPVHADGYKALAVSAGQAQGPVRILHCPAKAGDLGCGYVLVCPSTDPSWTPLFVNAAGLVLECGGTLSHGAVVAREMGLPAVVLPGATKLLSEGEEICVDGLRGWISPVCSDAARRSSDALAGTLQTRDDMSISRTPTPPPVGRNDRHAARISRILALVWSIYLATFFLLPPRSVQEPTLRVLDVVLWPVVRSLGRPAVVALVAVGVAVSTLLVQRLATDNSRLREAKRRAAALKKAARSLPKDAPRRALLLRCAAPVSVRTLMAAMIPIGILLGPMVMPFVWFRERIDPAVGAAPAGAAVQIVALVDSDWRGPVRIEVPPAVLVDEATPASRTLPPLRETLEHLLSLYRQPPENPGEPWELRVAPDLGREQTADDLQAYLDAGIPPQGLTWLIRPPQSLSGRFSVRVTAGATPGAVVNVTLGGDVPPAPRREIGPVGSPVKEVQVVYPKAQLEPVFWQPLAGLGGRAGTIDLGWLWLYIIVYLPTLVLVRMVLKVA